MLIHESKVIKMRKNTPILFVKKKFNWFYQKGITLIEIMIAMGVMLIVLSAILYAVASSTATGLMQQNLSRMMENGQLALNILARSIRNAGYQELIAAPNPLLDRGHFGQYLLGCSNSSISSDRTGLPNWGASCSGTNTSDAIAMRFQGGQLNQLPGLTSGTTSIDALDCAGQLVARSIGGISNEINRGDGNNITIVDNRFYINNNTLTCLGNGSNSALPLVQNIEEMKFWYGVSDRVVDSGGFTTLQGFTKRYMTANELNTTYSTESNEERWSRVTAVRICIVVRSANRVGAESYDYKDCSGNIRPGNGDQHLRRAMFTTIEISNVAAGL